MIATLRVILLSFILFLSTSIHSQDWVFQAKGISGSPLIPTVFNNIAETDDGNIYLTSSVSDSTQFGSFILHGTEIVPGIYLNAGYLAMLNSSGTPQWVKTFNGTGQFIINDLTTDSEGNAIVVGTITGEVTLDQTTLESNFSSGEFLLAKFDPMGNLLWTFMADSQPGFSRSAGVSVATNSKDDIVVSGVVESNVIFGGVEVQAANNLFLASFDKDGGFSWFRTYGYFFQLNTATEIAIDSEDNICWVGATASNVNGDLVVFDTISFQAYNSSMFVAKFNSMGDIIWLNHYGEDPDPNALAPINSNNITIDHQTNDLIIAGTFRDMVSLDGITISEPTLTGTHLFVARFDSNGAIEWVKQSHGVANGVDVFDISSTSSGSSFIGMQVSSSQGLSDFILGEGSNEKSFEINGTDNGVLAKYDKDGNLEWMKGISGFGLSPIMSVIGTDNESALISGIFTEQVLIGDTILIPGPTLSSGNVYVAHCSENSASSTIDSKGSNNYIQAYPNPSNDEIVIKWDQQVNVTRIQLFSLNGQMVVEKLNEGSQSRISVQHLIPGTYILKVDSNEGVVTKKIIIH